MKDSHFKLLNANCQTLPETMCAGGDGYCGIMCNYHPALYSRLGENFESDPDRTELVRSVSVSACKIIKKISHRQ